MLLILLALQCDMMLACGEVDLSLHGSTFSDVLRTNDPQILGSSQLPIFFLDTIPYVPMRCVLLAPSRRKSPGPGDGWVWFLPSRLHEVRHQAQILWSRHDPWGGASFWCTWHVGLDQNLSYHNYHTIFFLMNIHKPQLFCCSPRYWGLEP